MTQASKAINIPLFAFARFSSAIQELKSKRDVSIGYFETNKQNFLKVLKHKRIVRFQPHPSIEVILLPKAAA